VGGTYEFDGHLLIVQQVCPLEYDPKRALADLLAHAVVDADDIGRGRGGHRDRESQLAIELGGGGRASGELMGGGAEVAVDAVVVVVVDVV
jgi:hypothetical protein